MTEERRDADRVHVEIVWPMPRSFSTMRVSLDHSFLPDEDRAHVADAMTWELCEIIERETRTVMERLNGGTVTVERGRA